jgi:hypothetical protein
MKMFSNITRKAILIGCPGKKDRLLRGVKIDLLRISKFLQSDKGGAWNRNEIFCLEDPGLTEVISIVKAAIADYVFVYFSGHGYTGIGNSRMITLRDQSMNDLNLLNSSPRQLVVVDACRNYTAPGLGDVPAFEDDVDHFEAQSTYELFSECIATSPEGKLIIHSTQPGKYAYDSPSGGYFTQALLHISTHMSASVIYTPCSIQSVLNHVPRLLQANSNNQIPGITYSEGHLAVPFAFSSNAGLESKSQIDSSKELTGAILVTLALVCVVIAVSN